MLHHLALSALPPVDVKVPSQNHRKLSRAELLGFGVVWAKEILVFPGNRPKKVPKMA